MVAVSYQGADRHMLALPLCRSHTDRQTHTHASTHTHTETHIHAINGLLAIWCVTGTIAINKTGLLIQYKKNTTTYTLARTNTHILAHTNTQQTEKQLTDNAQKNTSNRTKHSNTKVLFFFCSTWSTQLVARSYTT